MKRNLFVVLLFVFTYSINAQQSLFLPGGNSGVNIGDLDIGGTQITVEALIYKTGSSTNVVSKHTGPNNVNYLLRPTYFEITTSSGYIQMTNPYILQNNRWYHIAGTYDGSFVRYYVNGCMVIENPWSGTIVTNDLQACIGNISTGQNEAFTGYIDEVRLWNIARTEQQIKQNMTNLPNPNTYPNLLAYYKFEGNYNNVLGTGYNGVLLGSPSLANTTGTLPTEFLISNVTETHLTCFNHNTGSISITPSVLTGTTYAINNGTYQSSNTFSNLSANTYYLAIRSQEGCILRDTVDIIQPTDIQITKSTQNIACFGDSTGSIQANTSGGTPNYSYLWNSGQTSATLTNLQAGTYILTVEDDNQCVKKDTTIITQPPALQKTSTIQQILCDGDSTGQITLNVTGGAPNYSYNWNSGHNTSAIQNLPVGTYSVEVSDQNNCIIRDTISLSAPLPLQSTLSVTHIDCFGNQSGAISVATQGGIPTYSYQWNSGQNSNAISNLQSGTYILTTQDLNSCLRLDTVNILTPNEIQTQINKQDIDCFGNQNGEINVQVNGGIPNYSYQWNTGQTSASLTNIQAGTYILTVEDSNQCVRVDTIEIISPSALLITEDSLFGIGCNSLNNGAIYTSISGGTPAYSLQWSNGSNTNQITQLTQGNYTLQVTDANQCTISRTFSITKAPSPVADFISMHNCENQTIQLTNQSSQNSQDPIINYYWNFQHNSSNYQENFIGNAWSSQILNDTGSYQVVLVVETQGGCYDSITQTYFVHPSPITDFDIELLCFGKTKLHANPIFEAAGDWQYQWNNGNSGQIIGNQKSIEHTFVNEGLQNVLLWVTDKNGCKDSVSKSFTTTASFDTSFVLPNIFKLSSTQQNNILDFSQIAQGFNECIDYSFSIFNRWGQVVYSYTNDKNQPDSNCNQCFKGYNQLGNPLTSGIYFYVFEGDGNIVKKGSISIFD